MGNITINSNITGGGGGGTGDVGGGSNLTTVGAIPYVSASGVLNQTANLSFDVANNRLVLGSATVQRFSTDLSLSRASAGVLQVGDGAANSNGEVRANAFGNASGGATQGLQFAGSNTWLNGPVGAFSIGARTAAGNAIFVATTDTRNLLIGTTTDSNFKLDVAASGSAGTARFYGGSGVSNSTKVVVQAGGGQSGNLQEWQNAAGTALAYVSSIGSVYSAQRLHTTGDVLLNNSGAVVMDTGGDGVLRLRDNSGTNFSRIQLGGTTSSFPSLKRSSAILQARLADDSANTQMQASRFISDQTTPAASTDAGTAGAIWADENYIYVQTAAGTIKRVALTTF